MKYKLFFSLLASGFVMGCLLVSQTSTAVTCNAQVELYAKHPSFMVNVEGLPSAGYLWRVTNQPQWLHLEHTETIPSVLIGGPTQEAWTFHASDEAFLSAQTATLDLTFARPWEKGEPAAKICRIILVTHTE